VGCNISKRRREEDIWTFPFVKVVTGWLTVTQNMELQVDVS